MSKPNSTAIIEGLPQNQRDQLESWLFEENISYKDAAKRLREDFNISIAPSSLCAWRQRREKDRMFERIAASRGLANQAVERFRQNPADMYQVLLDVAGQIAFDKAFQSSETLDAETIFNFTKLVMEGKKILLQEKKISLAERKIILLEVREKACAAVEETAKRGKLDAATKKELLEAIDKKLLGE